MADEIACSLPDTQTQTQGSQLDWSQECHTSPIVIPTIWGRLHPTKDSLKKLGSTLSSSAQPLHSIVEYIDITEVNFTLGRALSCDYCFTKGVITDEILKSISKEHFMLSRDTNQKQSPVFLHDLSYNGTFINGRKIGKGNKVIIENKDEISISQPNAKLFVFVDLFKNEQDQSPIQISSKYFISKILGTGACGVVKLVYNKTTCRKYAMKIITKRRISNVQRNPLNDPAKIMNEVKILKALQHPCIISTEEVVDTPEAVYIILELMEGGELFDRVSSNGRLSERCAKIIFRQMVLAVKYLHEQGITHRDLKPENVLLQDDAEEPLVKLTDFGLSKFVGEESFMRTMCGTPLYVAPEVLLADGKGSYGPQVDVWSLGVILFICLSGYLPFSAEYKDMSLRDQILKSRYMFSRKHWAGVSHAGRQLVVKMLLVDPTKRISLQGILLNEWMQDESVITRVNELMNINPKEDCNNTVTEVKADCKISNLQKRILKDSNQENNPPSKKMKLFYEGVLLATVVQDTASDDTVDNLPIEALSFEQ